MLPDAHEECANPDCDATLVAEPGMDRYVSVSVCRLETHDRFVCCSRACAAAVLSDDEVRG